MSAAPKKIVYLLSYAPFLVTHRLLLARSAKAAGFEVHVLAPHHSTAADVFKQEGFIFHPLALERGGMNALRELKAFVQIARILAGIKPTIVHSVALKCVLYTGLISYLLPIPKRVNAISGLGFLFMSEAPRTKLLKALLLPFFRLALRHKNTHTIFQNPDDLHAFLSNSLLKQEHTVMIRGSGVDVNAFSPAVSTPAAPPVRIAMVARFLIDKGAREFIEAARIIKRKAPEAQCIMVGYVDPQNPSSLSQQEVDNAVAEGIITNLGERSDIADIYRSCHIACLPSYREGLPKSLLEGGACGLPIVTTDAPGCREVVEHGINGFLVPVKDVQSLADALLTLVKSEDLRSRMGAACRQKVEREFSVEHVVAATLPLYGSAQ